MYWVYVIQSQTTGKIYIGHTENIKNRLKRHNQQLPSKKKSYTRINKGPWRVIYKEKINLRSKARIREKQLKSYRGREFIKKITNVKGP